MDTDYNVHGALPLLFLFPCWLPLSPLCSPLNPLLLTWKPPSWDRIRQPRSQVACELTPLSHLLPKPSPFQIPRTPTTQRLTRMTLGTIRRLLSGTATFELFCGIFCYLATVIIIPRIQFKQLIVQWGGGWATLGMPQTASHCQYLRLKTESTCDDDTNSLACHSIWNSYSLVFPMNLYLPRLQDWQRSCHSSGTEGQ